MGLSRKANGSFKRHSTGPLYSESQLQRTDARLRAEGMTETSDSVGPGARIYQSPDRRNSAVVYLDTLGCDPMASGLMMIHREGRDVVSTAVWTYGKAGNPVSRLLRRAFS